MYKVLLVLLAAFITPFAVGQYSAPVSSTYQPPSHAETAGQHSLQTGQSLISDSVTTASGEMPIADVPLPAVHEEPLGTVARRYRNMSKDAQALSAQPILKRSAGAYPGWWLAD
ncbi:MAG: hypothetical protein WA667_16955 [Candidatus Nitrosopolaris sp.]